MNESESGKCVRKGIQMRWWMSELTTGSITIFSSDIWMSHPMECHYLPIRVGALAQTSLPTLKTVHAKPLPPQNILPLSLTVCTISFPTSTPLIPFLARQYSPTSFPRPNSSFSLRLYSPSCVNHFLRSASLLSLHLPCVQQVLSESKHFSNCKSL